jgi:hypothetical protein
MRARSLYELGQHEAGRRELDALLGESVVSPQAAVEFLRREGRRYPADAQRQLGRALRHAPGSYELLAAMTRLDVETGQADRALRRLDKVIESQLAVPRVLLLRAELLSLAGELRPAEADALKALEADPQLPGVVDLLFAIYERQGRLAEALRAFEEAASVGVLHPGARVLLGRLYLSQGRSDEARKRRSGRCPSSLKRSTPSATCTFAGAITRPRCISSGARSRWPKRSGARLPRPSTTMSASHCPRSNATPKQLPLSSVLSRSIPSLREPSTPAVSSRRCGAATPRVRPDMHTRSGREYS